VKVSELEELQTRLAFLEDHLAVLNERVAAQDGEIEALQLQLRHLSKKLADAQELGDGISSEIEHPPHY
jgi:SlyX protein